MIQARVWRHDRKDKQLCVRTLMISSQVGVRVALFINLADSRSLK
jgi:hypothetical protein